MKIALRTVHKFIGISTIIIFILTGIYMRLNIPNIDLSNATLRMMFRANHVYIMFAGVINICLGCYFSFNNKKWKQIFQYIGSGLITIFTFTLIFSFFTEPVSGSLERSITGISLISIFAGALFHLVSGTGKQENGK